MGSTVWADQQHNFHPCRQLFLSKRTLHQIDIPPRKLLSRRSFADATDIFVDSPRSAVDETLHQKFLPYNNSCFDDDADPYSSDHFRIYEFKVRRCTRSRSHDWTDCPFAHPGEKARRRDPRRYHYSGTVCAEFRGGGCSRGDNCEFAHGVFECWLHPSRYRTEACKDGKNCKRKVCFFAHTPKQLRVLPSHGNDSYQSPLNSPIVADTKYQRHNGQHCCGYCHCMTASPTSTLVGMSHLSPPMSPSLSPPVSPVKSRQTVGISPISRFGDRLGCVELNQVLSNKDAHIELMSSLESMSVSENSPHGWGNNREMAWMDVSKFNGDDQQQQFFLSPSTPIPSGSGHFFSRDCSSMGFTDENGSGGPDIGWVSDLLT